MQSKYLSGIYHMHYICTLCIKISYIALFESQILKFISIGADLSNTIRYDDQNEQCRYISFLQEKFEMC